MILMYHKVDVKAPTMWWVDVSSFYRQMCLLKGYRVVYLDDYDPEDADQVVITFDGVYKNVLEYAAPIMSDFHYPFELFISSDWVGLKNKFDFVEPPAQFASRNDLDRMMAMGGRLQWHTRSHPLMKQCRSDSDWSVVEQELTIPEDIGAMDPAGFRWFAYPYGEFSEDVRQEVGRRFSGAVSCNQGDDRDMYRLNRVTATNAPLPIERSVCVIVVSHNYGEYLAEAVESVLAQTYAPNSVLIMDDASEDGTEEIGKRYAGLYPELISYERNQDRLGIVATFNRAVSATSSDLICFLGADNRLSSNYVEMCIRTILQRKVDIAYTDFRLFGKNASVEYYRHGEDRRGRVIDDQYYEIVFPEFAPGRMMEGNFIHGSAMYTRKAFEAIDGYHERRPGRPEDANLFRRMLVAGFGAYKVQDAWLEYRQHSEEQANIVSRMQGDLEFYRVYAKRLEFKVKALEVSFGALSPVVRLASVGEKACFELLVKMARLWRRLTR
jgi:GT2 family glycosyltransferase/peptidoglycan/xylan/chitin deacetylase (PgdA/CDA1 family)